MYYYEKCGYMKYSLIKLLRQTSTSYRRISALFENLILFKTNFKLSSLNTENISDKSLITSPNANYVQNETCLLCIPAMLRNMK